jgi:FlaA1/EpsC-like NDP-sugar epimerase
MITGTNFCGEWKSDVQSYHFSDRMDVWGWATWRRAWKTFDPDMAFFRQSDNLAETIRNLMDTEQEIQYTLHVLELIEQNKIDSWAYPWNYSNLMQNGLSIVPSVNLVSNIGFGTNSTHTKSTLSPAADLPARRMPFPLKHPRYVMRDKEYKFQAHRKINELRIIIFGAGDSGIAAYWYLKNKGIIEKFCDNDPAKWGTKLYGIEVIPPSELPQLTCSYVLIASARYKEIASQLEEMGIHNYRIFHISIAPARSL